MGIKNFFLFLVSTVLIGAITGWLFSILGVLIHISWYNGIIEGGMLATNCLMGFWAYLMLEFTASITLPVRVWRWSRVLILILVLYDMLFWRYQYATSTAGFGHGAYLTYFLQGMWPFLAALLGGYLKYRSSGKGSFIPIVFFLYVFTVLDWMLVLKLHISGIVNQTGIIMMVCNFYLVWLYDKLLNHRPLFSIAKLCKHESVKERNFVSTKF